MMNIYCFVFLLPLVCCKILVPSHSDSSPITEETLLKDPHILVEASSSQLKADDFDLAYKKLVVMGKNKRQTYEHFRKKYQLVVSTLIT